VDHINEVLDVRGQDRQEEDAKSVRPLKESFFE
jgi:hypothetical protein